MSVVPFATIAISRRRYGPQTIDPATRRPAPQSPTTSTIYASIQPPTDRDMQTLTDGERTRRVLVVYTTTDTLRTAEQVGALPADEVVIAGETYQVRRVERWRQVRPHDRAVCVRLQEIGP